MSQLSLIDLYWETRQSHVGLHSEITARPLIEIWLYDVHRIYECHPQ